jgi:predicted phosphodiesterase
VTNRPRIHLSRQEYIVKKLTLNIEALRVDSYETTTANGDERGTILGHSHLPQLTYTADFSCGGSTCGSPTNAARCYAAVDPVNE